MWTQEDWTYRRYSATCTPALLSLLSAAIAKYSALEGRESGGEERNRKSRSERTSREFRVEAARRDPGAERPPAAATHALSLRASSPAAEIFL